MGKIIPGVSGSMLAISMGIYPRLLYCINNILKLKKNDYLFLIKLSIGILLSILCLSRLIIILINKFYLATIFLFIGLILGSIGNIKKNIKRKNNYILLFCFIFITLFGLININNEINISIGYLNAIYFTFIGFVEAFTMVVPGISGTATLMMLGAYNKVIEMYSNIININYIGITIPFFIGVIIGILITSKLINYLLKKYESQTYSAILGFSYSTILLMFIKSISSNYNIFTLLMAFLFLILGFKISRKIS